MLKYCAVISLCAGLMCGADFISGQGARLVIGQATFTQQNSGTSDSQLGAVGGLAFANNTLFVADSNRSGLTPLNNRVLLFTNLNQILPAPFASIPPNWGRCPVCVGNASVVLGQPDFGSSTYTIAQNGMRLPTAVATDGVHLAVADTSNNRVLLWNSIPATINQPADLVLGQPDFITVNPVTVTSSTVRAPQGLWIQYGKLYVADTLNNRVLIWNNIPTKNNQPADVVLGQSNFTTVPNIDLSKATLNAQNNTMLNPVSVTSDGVRLYVADLGHNRVLIWNSIPTQNQQAADVEIGQQDFLSATANDVTNLCASNGTDSSGNPTYPTVCEKTLSFPRFALSDGKRLFVADGGNDRVLIYNTIPTQNTAAADVVLGQPDFVSSVVTSTTDLFHPLLKQSAADVTPTPTSLAWDGTNLFVTDPSNRRVLVFTPLSNLVPVNGVRNAASKEVFALGSFTVSGNIAAGDTVTLTVGYTSTATSVVSTSGTTSSSTTTCPTGTASASSSTTCCNIVASSGNTTTPGATCTNYTYTVIKGDTLITIMQGVAKLVDAAPGDPYVTAAYEASLSNVKIQAKKGGPDGNNITIAQATSANAQVTPSVSGANLTGGQDAGILAPGTIISYYGTNLAPTTASADPNAASLPLELGGVQAYIDGIRSPLLYVSPTEVRVQVPFETSDGNSSSTFLRIKNADGSITATTALGLPIAQQNPGIFAYDGDEPRVAIAYHYSSYATGTISLDGSAVAGDTATINIEDRPYSYVVQVGDQLSDVRDALVDLINANPDERVVASAASAFTRVNLRAKVPGPEGNNIAFSGGSSANASISVGGTNTALCCANVAGSPVTQANPAVPGEKIYVFGTGLGLVKPDDAQALVVTGQKYTGPAINDPNAFVSSLAGGSTANVISGGMAVGGIGTYQVILELSPGVTPNQYAQLTISQDIYTSNVVTIPIGNPGN